VGSRKPREIAVRVLRDRARGIDYTENLLERALPALAPADRGLCQELVCGVVRREATLDWLIARRTEGRTQNATLQILLRLGLYQVFWLDRIPDHAVVNECVTLARQLGFGPKAGFVNAVLRGCIREREETKQALEALKVSNPPLGYSHPDWLWDRWHRRWGDDSARRLLDWNNTPPALYARVNTLRVDAEKLLAQWRDEGVHYDFFSRDWLGENLVFEMKSLPPLGSLASLRDGWFYVQDPSTLLSVRELDPQPGETILDFCAAPGGKTTALAQVMQNRGRIVAQDRQFDRLPLLRQNCDRLGATCVEISRGEGVIFPELNVHFDRILVDAPCSNSGVMRRRVDLRWRVRPEEIDRLQRLQAGLLDEAAKLLKPGGTLVYSTCSLEPEENEGVVEPFLAAHAGFACVHRKQLTPMNDAVDGAFVATFKNGPKT
jgi:16S rRNA (cytosine967-C5)-methyltransferase